LPGIDEKIVEVKVANGILGIKGEKQEEKEEKKRDLLPARAQLWVVRALVSMPDGVDSDKVEANFKKGVLTVTLQTRRRPEKTITVKAA
jgi:HSP20 family protein